VPECARKTIANHRCRLRVGDKILGGSSAVLIVRNRLIPDVLGQHDLVVYIADSVRKELTEWLAKLSRRSSKRTIEIQSAFESSGEMPADCGVPSG
jgi:hypothetical protein